MIIQLYSHAPNSWEKTTCSIHPTAQACGTAVIGTRTGGIPDAVEENNGGWLIHQDAHEELENLLIKLIDDKSLAINEGRNARRRIEAKITWEHYVDQICDVIL